MKEDGNASSRSRSANLWNIILNVYGEHSFQSVNPRQDRLPADRALRRIEQDKVYFAGEVDREAELRNEDKVLKEFQQEFKCCEGSVKITLLLHKSGKVTNVKTEATPNCNVTEKGRKILRRFKFAPAIKNGTKVSEYLITEIKREIVIQPPDYQTKMFSSARRMSGFSRKVNLKSD